MRKPALSTIITVIVFIVTIIVIVIVIAITIIVVVVVITITIILISGELLRTERLGAGRPEVVHHVS